MTLEKEQLIRLYTNLVRARKLDETVVRGIAEGKTVAFFHSGQGEEAVGVGGCTFLREGDYIYPHHRGHGVAHALSKGMSPKGFLAEHFGKATGSAGGIAGFHAAEPEIGIMGAAGTIGSQFPVSLGWGLAAKKRGKGQVTVCFFGDGSSNRGTLHEAMNLAAVWKLPIVWVCHNNLYAQFMPIKDAYPKEDIADLAAGYGMPGVVVDGQDVVAVHEAVQAAVARARAGDGPSFVECKTYRYRAHVEGVPDVSHAQPRPAEEVEAWKKRDPINLFRERLLEQGVLSQDDTERIDREVAAEIDEAERFAMDSPVPDPTILEKVLYAD
ncbi:MAG: thiamine pyrophosphate-dependent dehydrogenase E1 component subunit alpha [Dehalococcoidia bacterium]